MEEEDEANIKAHDNIWAAIWTIIVADAVMSLDNAIAIAAAAKGNFTLIVIGLVMSIPIIVVGATLISACSTAIPGSASVGAALIGWIAGEVMAGDGRFDKADAGGKLVEVVKPGSSPPGWTAHLRTPSMACAALGAGLVLVVGLYLARRPTARHAERVLDCPMEALGLHFGADQLGALLQVVLIDLVMSGDNAIIIGMAVAGLPKENRTKIIFWGVAGATMLRIGFAAVTTQLCRSSA